MAGPSKIETVKVPVGPSKESAYNAINGVTVDWLRRAFHMSAATCERKLKGLKPKGVTNLGADLYDFHDACSRLVKPKMDLSEYLSDITVDDLPDKLKEPFWNAKLKQQRYEKNAGELWRTEAVIQLFGSVLKDIKERMKLIADMSEKSLALSPDQLQGLREIVNDVQAEVYKHIISLESKTPASVAELNRELSDDEEPDYKSPVSFHDDDFEY